MVDMGTKRYYNDLYTIESNHRRMKYEKLLISSMINDMRKWTQKIKSDGIPLYNSPNYGGSVFSIEARSYFTFAFITHSTPIILGQQSELIVDEGDEKSSKEFRDAFIKIRDNIYTTDIYDIEKQIGNQHSRKEKLDALELGRISEIIESLIVTG
jgi:hypothetical protein